MKILIVGLGSIGKRHAEILEQDFQHELFVYRSSQGKSANSLGIPEVYSWEEVEEIKPEVAFVTNPTYLHVKTALECAKRGMHLFIEKPLSVNKENIVELSSLCQEKNLTCYVAYCMRFNPLIKKIKELLTAKQIYHVRIVSSSYLPNWRSGRDHLQSYSASAEMGGGVLLDLSHEFDYIEHLFAPITKIQGSYGKISAVTRNAEDYADMVLTLETGVRVNLHLNFMSHLSERKIIVDYKDGYLIGDLIENQIVCYSDSKAESFNFKFDRNSVFKEQTEYFLDNLGSQNIMNNVQEAQELLAKIVRFKDG